MNPRQRAAEKRRAEMEAYRAQCAAALDHFDDPLPPKAVEAIERSRANAAFAASVPSADLDRRDPALYVAAELGTVDEDPDTGCHIWTGAYTDVGEGDYPKVNGVHEFCGRTHFQVARALMEEHLRRPLDQYTEKVFGNCATNSGRAKPCVNPAHHYVKENS